MKVSKIVAMRNFVGAFCLLAFPVSGALAQSGKYAVVDMQAVILNVEEGKKARSQLEKEIKDKQKVMQKNKEEVEKLYEDFNKQNNLLSDQARMTKQKEFQEKFMAFRGEEMKFQEEIKRKEQEATQKIAVNVTKLVSEMGKSKGFEMVFETSSAGLIYLKDPVDLTKEVIAAYEAQSKAPAKK